MEYRPGILPVDEIPAGPDAVRTAVWSARLEGRDEKTLLGVVA